MLVCVSTRINGPIDENSSRNHENVWIGARCTSRGVRRVDSKRKKSWILRFFRFVFTENGKMAVLTIFCDALYRPGKEAKHRDDSEEVRKAAIGLTIRYLSVFISFLSYS